jgi:hypothetical protein
MRRSGHSARDGYGETIAGASHPVLGHRVTMPLLLRRDPAGTPWRRLERRAPGEGRVRKGAFLCACRLVTGH